MSKHQLQTAPHPEEPVTTQALIHRLGKIAESHEQLEYAVTGLMEHGEAFAAFILGTPMWESNGEHWESAYVSSQLPTFRSREEAVTLTATFRGWDEALDALGETQEIPAGLLTWNVDAFWEELQKKNYAVESLNNVYLFDRAVLEELLPL